MSGIEPQASRPVRSRWPLWVTYICLGLCLVWLHSVIVNFGDRQADRAERHEQILSGQGESPWAYRVAMPVAAEGLRRAVVKVGIPQKWALEEGYLVLRGLGTVGLLLLFHRYLRRWLSISWAVGGTFLLAALHGPSYLYYWYQPDSPTDLLLWVAVAVLTLERKDRWIFPLILVGALNRETSVFMIVIHAALRYGEEPRSKLIFRSLVLFAIWAACFLGLRALIGETRWSHGATMFGLFLNNLRHPAWVLYAVLFFGSLWLLPLLGWRHFPVELRRMALGLTTYLGLQLIFGRIREVRILLPLAVVLIPMAMLYFERTLKEETTRPQEEGA